jgi:iron-sulfur cluster assembly protein
MRSLTVLTLTDDATMQIRNIIDSPGAPEGCGVRIATDPASGALSLALAATPAEDDKVLDEAGARVFLEPQAAVLLDDKALDANTDGAGQVHFSIADMGH